MSTEITFDNGNNDKSSVTKPENPKEVLLAQYQINAERFNLPMPACSDMLTYIKRGTMDHKYGVAERTNFIKDTLETFYQRRVRYERSDGTVIAVRLKSLSRLAFERTVAANADITGPMEACIKYDKGKHKPLWVDTKRLMIID